MMNFLRTQAMAENEKSSYKESKKAIKTAYKNDTVIEGRVNHVPYWRIEGIASQHTVKIDLWRKFKRYTRKRENCYGVKFKSL